MNTTTPRRQIAVGSVWSLVAFIVTTGSAAVLTILLVRLLPKGQYGIYAIAISILAVARILAGFGLNNASARLASAALDEHGPAGLRFAFRAGLRIAEVAAGVTLVAYGAILAVALAVPKLEPSAGVLLILLPAALLAGFVELCTGLARAAGYARMLTLITSTTALLVTGATALILLLAPRTAELVAVPISAGAAISATVLLWETRKWSRHLPSVVAGTSMAADFVRYGSSTVAAGLATAAIAYLDVVVLGIARGRRSVALYAPASVVATLVLTLPAVIAGFYLPVVTRPAAQRQHRQVMAIYHWASRWSLSLAAPALTLMIACPSQTMRLIFGAGFGVSGTALRILGGGAALQVAFGLNGLTLEAYGLPGLMARREMLGVGVSILACVILIPPLGALGAAWATTAGLTFANLSCSQVLLSRFGLMPWDRRTGLTLGAFLSGCVVALLIADPIASPVLSVVLALGLGLFPTLVTFLTADQNERRAIQALMWRRSSQQLTPVSDR